MTDQKSSKSGLSRHEHIRAFGFDFENKFSPNDRRNRSTLVDLEKPNTKAQIDLVYRPRKEPTKKRALPAKPQRNWTKQEHAERWGVDYVEKYTSNKNNFYYIDIDYRDEMRKLIRVISRYGRRVNHNFIVIPQSGYQLITHNGTANGMVMYDYLNDIDAIGIENLFYGYNFEDVQTPEPVTNGIQTFLNMYQANDKNILVTDYVVSTSKVDISYNNSEEAGYISFASSTRELNEIPKYPVAPYNNNLLSVKGPRDASNFLYLLDYSKYTTKEQLVNELASTNYDMYIIDPFYSVDTAITKEDVDQIRKKNEAGNRTGLVLAYLNIGEIESFRYYWRPEWDYIANRPSWIDTENPDWPGNFKVKYWEEGWEQILVGRSVGTDNTPSFMKKILEAGFDGVYLDGIDTFEHFD